MTNCIFCKIASGEAPASKIYEDNDFVAFLDINPPIKGMSLLISKKHVSSNLPEIDLEILGKASKKAQEISVMLKKVLNCQRVFLVIEGIEIPHFHIKLYPSFGKSLAGILRSDSSPANPNDLEELAKEIRDLSANT